MPAGKYSLYLYHDDPRDMQARATIERVSQPLRGEFLRAAAISGGVLYRIDVRLPAMLSSLFVEQLRPGQFTDVLVLLSGNGQMRGRGDSERYPWEPGRYTGTSERRRFNLILNEDEGAEQLTQLLNDATSRQRGTLLRELVIAGCALHELDNRFPRLLSSLPEPPASVLALQELTGKLFGQNVQVEKPNLSPVSVAAENKPESSKDVTRENMKKLF